VATTLLNYIPAPNILVSAANFGSQANYLQQTPTPSDTNGFDLRVDRTINSKQSLFVRWSWKRLNAQSLTDSYLSTLNSFLPPDHDTEHNNNLIVSHNYLITNNLVNEARFGVSLWQLQVRFPIQGAAAVSTLGLMGLDLNDHPNVRAFPIFNFSDDPGNYSPIGRDKDGTTKSQTVQFADNLTWIKGRHTMKFGVDTRPVAYVDLESFGGADDFDERFNERRAVNIASGVSRQQTSASNKCQQPINEPLRSNRPIVEWPGAIAGAQPSKNRT
jgi:hypothetical protein